MHHSHESAIKSLVIAATSAVTPPVKKSIRFHSHYDYKLYMEIFSVESAEKTAKEKEVEMYYTKDGKSFKMLALAKGSTLPGNVYEVRVMSNGTKKYRLIK